VLATQALHHYAEVEGPHRSAAATAYQELRAAVLGNIVRIQQDSGFPWESYSDTDGSGRGSHPFTGWTALFVLVAAELYS